MGAVFANPRKLSFRSSSRVVSSEDNTDDNTPSRDQSEVNEKLKTFEPTLAAFKGVYESVPLLCRDEFISKYTREVTHRWREAVVQEYASPEVRIRFLGWSEKHDVWLNLQNMSHIARLAPPKSLTDHSMANGIPLSDKQILKTIDFLTSSPKSSPREEIKEERTISPSDAGMYTAGEMVDVQDFYKSSDHRKIVSKWRKAVIKEVSGDMVRVSYVGWDSTWDEVLNATTTSRIRPAGSMTSLQSEKRTRRSFDDLAVHERDAMVDAVLSSSDPYHRKQHKSLVRTRSYPPVSRIESAEAIFKAKLEANGLHIIRVDGDGNCLFRAVAHQIWLDESRHGELRERCVQHMKENWDRFKSFCDNDFDVYLRGMELPGTWGDNLEIFALEEILDRFISIYSSEEKEVKPMNIHFDDDFRLDGVEPILLTYHGQSHYNSLFNERCPLPLQSRKSKVILEYRTRGIGGTKSDVIIT